ncbi:hypothetical protein [Algibacter mikhailovii]|uniref:Lipoprotein n=1 Tax=Algibacter mikhailovii TaxID=425498 RepID=A0A918V5B0_9FLAO|nr:hypothetical protein [Algibacter mikhailovii]GGZ72503.1 hypothetical protein GCM10007028_06910 [Algibacter mikhailovii]
MKHLCILFILLLFSCKLKNNFNSNDIPPAPPFQEANALIQSVNQDCYLPKETLNAYVISYNENTNGAYEMVYQDLEGIRGKCIIDKTRASNFDRSWLPYILIPGNKIEIKIEICDNDNLPNVLELKNLKRHKGKTEQEYSFGVPQAPLFQEAHLIVQKEITLDCFKLNKKLTGYILSIIKKSNEALIVDFQDTNGVRHKCYISTDSLSKSARKELSHILTPGNKTEMTVEACGSGGFISVLEIKNLKRNN